MTRAFISYSHADDALRAEFNKHLSLLRRQGLLELWSDHRIPAGGEFDKHISAELEAADIIILLISPDFMASDYCYGIEMKRAMERHQAGSAVVIPVILRPVDWHSAPFGALKALPRDGKPVVKWPTLDDAFLDVVQALRSLLPDRHPPPKLPHPLPRQARRLTKPPPSRRIAPAPERCLLHASSRTSIATASSMKPSPPSRPTSKIRYRKWASATLVSRASFGGSRKSASPQRCTAMEASWQVATSASPTASEGSGASATRATTVPKTTATTRC